MLQAQTRDNLGPASANRIPVSPLGRSQRTAPRRPVSAEVSVRERGSEGSALPLELVEVSAAGAFVSSSLLLPVGAEVELEFSLPDRNESFMVQGKVARVHERPDRPGMGIVFEKVDPDHRAILRAFTI